MVPERQGLCLGPGGNALMAMVHWGACGGGGAAREQTPKETQGHERNFQASGAAIGTAPVCLQLVEGRSHISLWQMTPQATGGVCHVYTVHAPLTEAKDEEATILEPVVQALQPRVLLSKATVRRNVDNEDGVPLQLAVVDSVVERGTAGRRGQKGARLAHHTRRNTVLSMDVFYTQRTQREVIWLALDGLRRERVELRGSGHARRE